MTDKEIVIALKRNFGNKVLINTPFPSPYPKNFIVSKIKAIYLGCDPSNKHCKELPYVFAHESNLSKFNSFISQHTNQLHQIGLDWTTVYTQNLCKNYFEKETSKNLTLWKKVADWLQYIAPDFYECKQLIPVPPDKNRLNRPLIPLYRGKSRRYPMNYHLKNEKWKDYKEKIIRIVHNLKISD